MSYSRDSLNDLFFNSTTGKYENVNKPERLYGWDNFSPTYSVPNKIVYTISAIPSANDDVYDQYGNKLNKKVGQIFGNGASFKFVPGQTHVNIDGFTYTTSGDGITLETYTGSNTTVVISALEEI